jgi:hypothetical protein
MRRLLALAVLAPLFALVPTTAHAQAPDATGWWSSTHRSALPPLPPPPDVAAGDLLLQGGDIQRELPGTAPAPTALAALRYAVPEGATVTGLTLALGTGAQAADVRAYATTSSWKAVENGAIEEAPVPDLSRYAVATLSSDGTRLTVPDIGKLTSDSGLLDVVLIPGVSDRVVVLHPTATALTVTQAPQLGGPPAVPPPPPTAVPVLPAVAPGPQQVAPPPLAPTVPQVAPASTPPAPVVPARPVSAAVGRRIVGDDRRARLVVVLEALLVATFFGLLGHGPLGLLGRLTGNAAIAEPVRGVGRFRAVREGTAPRL